MLRKVDAALAAATGIGAFDAMAIYCHPDIINNFANALSETLECYPDEPPDPAGWEGGGE